MKKTVRIIIFVIIFCWLFNTANEVFVEKSSNRYYMLSKELGKTNNYDVMIFGSCHAYTSFNPMYLKEQYGIDSYNMSNPSEIMPATYLRILEQLKQNKPQIVLVETWGLNPYETYIPTEDIMKLYFPLNIENISYSREKLEVINDFETLDFWEDNFAVFKYRSRLLENSLSEIDFKYSFKTAKKIFEKEENGWMYEEMENRFKNNGYLERDFQPLLDYLEHQGEVTKDETLAIEADIMKYIDKIIEVCNAYNVELIFYRAPYVSTDNELRKVNYLEQYLGEQGVEFYDMEKEISYDYSQDFYDYQHLSKQGAKKTTEYLSDIIAKRLN